jgi:phospholipid/cholesterol/gamma-HCH transport system substrate-binding protein
MKISNETKVGILTIVALTLLIVGFNFLKGKNVFNKEKHLYAVFSDLGSLRKSNEVKMKGLPVGTIYDYTEIDKNLSGIIVTITMKRDVNIPKDSKATIESELLGNTYMNVVQGQSIEFLEDGDTIVTDRASSFLGDVKAQITPTLTSVRSAIDSLKIVLGGLNRLFEKDTKGNISEIIRNLKQTTGSLNKLLDAERGALAATLDNANSITGNLKKNNDSITATISSIKKAADKFSGLEVQPTIDTLQATINELKTVLSKFNTNEGTLGLLMKDRKLYDQLNSLLLGVEILFDDIRVNPKRYTGSVIFNRKDKSGPLTSPAKKDSIPQGNQK